MSPASRLRGMTAGYRRAIARYRRVSPLSTLRKLRDTRRIGLATLAALVLLGGAGAAGAWYFTRAPHMYQIGARFANGQGLFPGATVSVLGVKVGTVTRVQFEGSSVLVMMAISDSQHLPRNVNAQLVAPLLLGTPDVELGPGYTGGPMLAAGSIIPETQTAVPVSTDQLLAELQRVLGAIKPRSAKQLVSALAADIQGQGATLNHLLGSAASTVSLLAAKGNDLGRLNGELAALTGTLRAHESELATLINDYNTVAAVLASHQQALGQAITQLANASGQLAQLLTPNLRPIEQDVAVITTVGRTLDRNLAYLDQTVISTASLFAGARRAYDPVMHWLNLNDQLSPGMTGGVVTGLVRDRLAGVCRRILANHSGGLSTSALVTLATCGNPASGYFDPILSTIVSVLEGLPSANGLSGLQAAQQALTHALSNVPGLTPAQRRSVSSAISSGQPPPQRTAAARDKHESKAQALRELDQQLNQLLGPLPPGTGGTGSTGSSGLGGLLGAAS